MQNHTNGTENAAYKIHGKALGTNGNGNSNGHCKGTPDPLEIKSDINKSGCSRLDFLKQNGELLLKPYKSKYVELCFKSNCRRFFLNPNNMEIKYYEYLVVHTEGGLEIGRVESLGDTAELKFRASGLNEKELNHIVRKPTDDDFANYYKKLEDEEHVITKTRELVKKHNLDMKITESYWQPDRQKLMIYFTAPQRIDFRDLVKELAREFKTRIELRQISSREEAKRLGGFVGPCGRDMCCTTFLKEFDHITLDHARVQQLSNNISKLSGICGRLKCCIKYEYDNYADAAKHIPPVNSIIETSQGVGKVAKIDILNGTVTLKIPELEEHVCLCESELDELSKAGKVHLMKYSSQN